MSIKEFSQEHGVALFYTVIGLLIALIVLGVIAFGFDGRGNRDCRFGNFQFGDRQGMMQNRQRNFQNQQPIDQTGQVNTQAPVEGANAQ